MTLEGIWGLIEIQVMDEKQNEETREHTHNLNKYGLADVRECQALDMKLLIGGLQASSGSQMCLLLIFKKIFGPRVIFILNSSIGYRNQDIFH